MNKNPLVSVIIPVYNGSNYLAEAINSALEQTYKNIEIIVVNDGSNDNNATERIALSYGNKLRYFSKPNGGVASALNLGINNMQGDYFSWLSHDDLFVPNKTSSQIDTLINLNTRKPHIIYSDFDIINSNGEFIRKVNTAFMEPLTLDLLHSVKINGCTVLIPKECFEIVGLFDENNPIWADSKMWFLLSKQYSFIHIPVSLAKTRDHNNRTTYKITKATYPQGKYFCFAIDCITDYEFNILASDKNSYKIWGNIAIVLSRKGFEEAAVKALKRIDTPNKFQVILIKLMMNYYFIKRFIQTNIKRFMAYSNHNL